MRRPVHFRGSNRKRFAHFLCRNTASASTSAEISPSLSPALPHFHFPVQQLTSTFHLYVVFFFLRCQARNRTHSLLAVRHQRHTETGRRARMTPCPLGKMIGSERGCTWTRGGVTRRIVSQGRSHLGERRSVPLLCHTERSLSLCLLRGDAVTSSNGPSPSSVP